MVRAAEMARKEPDVIDVRKRINRLERKLLELRAERKLTLKRRRRAWDGYEALVAQFDEREGEILKDIDSQMVELRRLLDHWYDVHLRWLHSNLLAQRKKDRYYAPAPRRRVWMRMDPSDRIAMYALDRWAQMYDKVDWYASTPQAAVRFSKRVKPADGGTFVDA